MTGGYQRPQGQPQPGLEVCEQIRLLLGQVMGHGFGEVVIKVQEGRVVTVEKREVHKLAK